MKFLNHNLFTGDITVNGTTTLSTATGITRASGDNSTHLATTAFVKAQGYLTAEVDTLDTVTDRNSVTTNSIGVGTINIIGTTAGAELLTVDGTFGRLFTVTDDLSDSLFSVNTIAGLPVIEVFADNTINLGAFSNPITIDGSSNIVIPGTITASGYNDTNWNTAYNDRIVSAAVSGTTTKTLTLTQTDGGTISTSWTDINTDTDGYISNVSLVGSTLSFTSVGSAFSGIVDLSTLTPTVRTVYETVKNVSGATILKGTPLAVVPGQTSGNLSDVIPADASDPAKMPAVFIANQNIADEAEGEAVLFGNLTGVNTELYESGTIVYVAPGGGWTADKPIWPNLIQNLGVITKQHPTNGAGIVTGVGRANSLPNLTAGKIWVGSAAYPIESTTVHVDEANGRLGIGTATPDGKLEISSNTSVSSYITQYTDDADGAELVIRTARGTESSPVRYNTNDSAGRILFQAYTSSGEFEDAASIESVLESGYANSYAGLRFNYLPAVSPYTLTEGMRLNMNGNVGIGTTAPNRKLHVESSGVIADFKSTTTQGLVDIIGTSNQLRIGTFSGVVGLAYGTGTSPHITITSTGNVGIGTTSALYKLDVVGDLYVNGTNGAFTTDNSQSNLYFLNLTRSTASLVTAGNVGIKVANPTATLSLGTSSYDNNPLAGLEYFQVTGGGRLDLKVQTWGTGSDYGLTTGLTVLTPGFDTNNVRVGIGTASPAAKLHLSGSGVTELRITSTTGNTNSLLSFYESALASWGIDAGQANGSFFIKDLYNSATRLTISYTGNVGIGTTSPAYKLDISGQIRVDNGVGNGSGQALIVGGSGDVTLTSGGSLFFGAYDYGNSTYIRGYDNSAGLYFYADGTLTMNVAGNGNVGIATTSPEEKLHVAGNVRIDGGSTAAILETNDATAAEAGTTYKTFTTADNYAVFVDYVVYDAGRDNMRTGTFRAVWSTGDVVYTDVSTVDLGATDGVTLTAAISGANVNLIVTGPADYTLKYNLKVIK